MKHITRKLVKNSVCNMSAVMLSLIVVLGTSVAARADEADAKRLLRVMADYMAAQDAISFEFDATLEVVTKDEQKLALASTGAVTLNRPDKFRATRSGGFAGAEMLFDGKTLTLIGKNANRFTQIDVPGTVDHLVDELSHKIDMPLPAVELMMSNVYDELMLDVIDTKDLGSGVIDGIECDFLAFRKKEVDWQIWIAHGDRPYPCRYVITSKGIANGPQYSIQIRDWKTGDEVASDDFDFKNPTNAKEIELEELRDLDALPEHFKRGDAQ